MQNNMNQNMNNQQQNLQNNVNQNMNNQQQVNMLSNPYLNNQVNAQNQTFLNNNPYVNDTNNSLQNKQSGLNNSDFVKGALIGAGIAFLLSNKTTQNAIFNGFAKASDLFNMGMEEIKERIEDAKAQMEAKED